MTTVVEYIKMESSFHW